MGLNSSFSGTLLSEYCGNSYHW